jgi:transcriptional regulator with XRE-family HTH domain
MGSTRGIIKLQIRNVNTDLKLFLIGETMIALTRLAEVSYGMNFGRKIKHLLVEKDRRAQWLADKVGVSKAAVSRWIAGLNDPPLSKAAEIARALGVSLDWLADDAQDYPPATIYSAPPRPAGSIRYPEPPPPTEPAAPPPKRGRRK